MAAVLIRPNPSQKSRLRLLVVAPAFTQEQGDEALLAGSSRRNVHTAGELLAEITDQPVIDPWGHWTDDGGRA